MKELKQYIKEGISHTKGVRFLKEGIFDIDANIESKPIDIMKEWARNNIKSLFSDINNEDLGQHIKERKGEIYIDGMGRYIKILSDAPMPTYITNTYSVTFEGDIKIKNIIAKPKGPKPIYVEIKGDSDINSIRKAGFVPTLIANRKELKVSELVGIEHHEMRIKDVKKVIWDADIKFDVLGLISLDIVDVSKLNSPVNLTLHNIKQVINTGAYNNAFGALTIIRCKNMDNIKGDLHNALYKRCWIDGKLLK